MHLELRHHNEMRQVSKGMARAWVIALLVGFFCGQIAVADDLSDTGSGVFGSGMTYVPPTDLTGWFFNPDDPAALPDSDPTQIWTSPQNIATLQSWLALATDLGDNPTVLQEMYGYGMISAPTAAAVTAEQEAVALAVAGDTANPGAPEPVAFALLGGGLLMIGAIARVRTRQTQRYLIRNVQI